MLFGAHTALAQTLENGRQHIGIGLADLTQWALGHGQGYLASGRPRGSRHSNNQILVICGQTGVAEVEATLTSLNTAPAGFTINVTNAPSTAITVAYFIMEGGGQYAVGTTTTRASLGLQTIALPFTPDAVFFAWGQQSALGANALWTRVGYGAGDDIDPTHQYVAWTGARSSDVHTDNVARWDRVISMIVDADNAGPFDPLPITDASLVIGSNQFQLNYSKVDGSARYFSWFAVQNAEVGRITFQHSAADVVEVPTTVAPRGLIFFVNDQGLSDPSNVGDEGMNHGPSPGILGSTLGGTLSIGCCDEDLGGQFLAVMQDVNRGAGQQTMRRLESGKAFGAMAGANAVLANNFPRDCGVIIAVEAEEPEFVLVPMNWKLGQRSAHVKRLAMRNA